MQFDQKRDKFVQVGKTDIILIVPEDESSPANSKGFHQRDAVQWITAIEYLKAKLNYESFFNSYDRVNLALPKFSKNQLTTKLQKKEALNTRIDTVFSKEFAGNF